MVKNSDLFLFGDDLDAVPEALEANDIVDESFKDLSFNFYRFCQAYYRHANIAHQRDFLWPAFRPAFSYG